MDEPVTFRRTGGHVEVLLSAEEEVGQGRRGGQGGRSVAAVETGGGVLLTFARRAQGCAVGFGKGLELGDRIADAIRCDACPVPEG